MKNIIPSNLLIVSCFIFTILLFGNFFGDENSSWAQSDNYSSITDEKVTVTLYPIPHQIFVDESTKIILFIENNAENKIKLETVKLLSPSWEHEILFNSPYVIKNGTGKQPIEITIKPNTTTKSGIHNIIISITDSHENIKSYSDTIEIINAKKPESKIELSSAEIVLKKTTSLLDLENKEPISDFHIVNIGNDQIEKLLMFVGELELEKGTKSEVSSGFVSVDKINVNVEFDEQSIVNSDKSYIYQLAPLPTNTNSKVTVSISDPIDKIGQYKGKIIVFGDNFKTLEINTSLIIEHNPYDLIIAAIIGLSLAILTGIWFTKNKINEEYNLARKQKNQVIHELNDHIKRINSTRSRIPRTEWIAIQSTHDTYKHHIENHLGISSDINDEKIKWYNTKDADLTNKSTVLLNSKKNEEIPKINDIPEDKKLKDKAIKIRIDNNLIIHNLNDHIKKINSARIFIPRTEWISIQSRHNGNKHHIENHIGTSFAIDEGTVKWYNTTDADLTNKSTALLNSKMNEKIHDIDRDTKPPNARANITEKTKDDIRNPANIIFGLVAAATAIPTILVTKEYFMGDTGIDFLIAIGIGFGFYESKKVGEKINSLINR